MDFLDGLKVCRDSSEIRNKSIVCDWEFRHRWGRCGVKASVCDG